MQTSSPRAGGQPSVVLFNKLGVVFGKVSAISQKESPIESLDLPLLNFTSSPPIESACSFKIGCPGILQHHHFARQQGQLAGVQAQCMQAG